MSKKNINRSVKSTVELGVCFLRIVDLVEERGKKGSFEVG